MHEHPVDGRNERALRRTPIRLVVSRFEDVLCESPELEDLYGSPAHSAAAVAECLRPLLESEPVERFVALLLNGKHRVMGLADVSRGTLTSSLVHPREVFGPALRAHAAALIVAHNHPSGDPEPSLEDLDVTRRLRDAGRILGVPLLDHLVIGAGGSFQSLRERVGL
jgi:DNA repair protein RadC